MFVMRSNTGILLNACIAAMFLFYFQRGRAAVKLCIWACVLWAAVTLWSDSEQVLLGIIAFSCFLFLKFTPMAGAFIIMSQTVQPNELISALEKMYVPRSVTLTLAVTLRFIPTIGLEFGYIRDSMRARGIPLTGGRCLSHPIQMSEYVFLPMMMRFAKVAEELAAAAVTKGIERPGRRGSLYELRLRRADGMYVLAVILSCAVLVWFEYGWR